MIEFANSEGELMELPEELKFYEKLAEDFGTKLTDMINDAAETINHNATQEMAAKLYLSVLSNLCFMAGSSTVASEPMPETLKAKFADNARNAFIMGLNHGEAAVEARRVTNGLLGKMTDEQ